MARIVIALGGNALGNTPAEQRERVAAAQAAYPEPIAPRASDAAISSQGA